MKAFAEVIGYRAAGKAEEAPPLAIAGATTSLAPLALFDFTQLMALPAS
jgi:hypothetical protein